MSFLLFTLSCFLASTAESTCAVREGSNWSADKCLLKCGNGDNCSNQCQDHCTGCACPLVDPNATCDNGCAMYFDGCNTCSCDGQCTFRHCPEEEYTGYECISKDDGKDLETKVIYGEDDRKDYYEWVETHGEDDVFSRLMRESIVVMMEKSALGQPNSEGVYDNIQAGTLASDYLLCSGQRFGEQMTAGWCSGTLVDSTHITTAGHCITSMDDCNNFAFVFNYYITGYDGNTPIYQTITTDDVYSCVAYDRELTFGLFSWQSSLDWAYVTLDREVLPETGHVPAGVDTNVAPRQEGEGVVIIGSGSGLPMKIDNGGSVYDTRASKLDYFTASTDSFGGNSGSGVFNADGSKMIGILVRGEVDYSFRLSGFCYVVNELPEDRAGEDVTYAYHAIPADSTPDCESDDDCQEGSTCNNGSCIAVVECDCSEGEVCNESTGECIAAANEWFTMEGDCDLQDDNCVSSGNWPNNYGSRESCTITMLQDANVTPSDTWEVEDRYDHIIIDGVDAESSDEVPSFIEQGSVITWESDRSRTYAGWQLCFSTFSCEDDEEAIVEAAANAGFTITGCAQAASNCAVPTVQELCPQTCGQCPVSGCVDNDAGIRTYAAGFGITIDGCAQAVSECAMETVAGYCPVSCGRCDNSSN